ncbi:acetate--CoA ligase [Candidatus Microgenomates bacterium]|nr:acetate--CoA ligase [Candidatus Microgenomates bacterium]
MEEIEILKASDKKTRLIPNLPDYKSLYPNFSWERAKSELAWFPGGKINAAYNAVDRHLDSSACDKIALYWEGDKGEKSTYTFSQLAKLSNQWGNYLKKSGVVKGDRVFIFLPRIPDLFTSFLGILKIGAVAGTLFSAFQQQALFDRLEDSGAKILITNRELSLRLAEIRNKLPELKQVVIVDDNDFQKNLSAEQSDLEVMPMDPEDNAFMLYTSGTTGKPKGVVHKHLAILSQHVTAYHILDLHDEDIYWCTADPGWVTGIGYTILGSWSNKASEVIFSGRFDASRWYQILQDYKVTIWYTAPTAVRMLMAEGDLPKKYNLTSLRHILSVGEPLNPEAIRWGLKMFGLAFHDTWWQTETGCMCLVNYICNDTKLGSMGLPILGLSGGIVDDRGQEVPRKTEGNIALRPGWPSMMKEIWKRPEKYQSYFVNGWYISGDRGWEDEDGYFWFIGRSDDVIKTAGERVGPFEVESALIEHPAVVEAGVIGKPDELRGEIIKAFVDLKDEYKAKIADKSYEDQLKIELSQYVKKHLAGHAYPREVEFIDKLPKTRSGKIMRRILKAKEMGQPIGDTSTLEEY